MNEQFVPIRALDLDSERPDPWTHRSVSMKCATCIWFVAKEAGLAKGPVGRCRRHAPTMSGYPVVFQTDWCGDHKLDETKV